jgi:hypothetical protein
MSHRTLLVPALALAAVALAGCPKPRSSAATQPSPAAFVPTASDPKAVELVTAVQTKLGGPAAWESLKELSFTVAYRDGDTTKARFKHKWDRWNGRHYFATEVPSSETPGEMLLQEVKHDLFDASAKPWAAVDGNEAGTRDQAVEMAKVASQRLKEDLYFIAIVHKLKDPGVKLTVDNAQITVEGSTMCQPSCTSIKVSFDPAVGKDTWFVNVNNDTKEIQVIEKQMGGGRIGYEVGGWVDAGGLKWPTRFQNLGLKTEIIEYSDVAVGTPEDTTYMPQVR